MPNFLLLYNRKAGRQHSDSVVDAVIAVFEAAGVSLISKEIDFDKNPLDDVGDIDLVVTVGGDGTVGYIVDAMLHNGIKIPLGIIPAGTANDFATMLDIPRNPKSAALHILQSPIRMVDCGRVNGRFFINVFCFGLFTTTSQRTSDAHKRYFGRLAYIFEGLRELRRVTALPLHVRVEDGDPFDVEVITALVLNGQTAGRIPLAPMARCDDGELDMVFFTKRGVLRLILDVLRYFCGGKPSSVRCIRARSIRITSPLSYIKTDTDGQRGPDFPLEVECLAGSVRIKG